MRGSGPRMTFWLSQPFPEFVRESGMPKAPPLRLGVNVDHVATLRNARAGERPDPVRAALVAIEAGGGGHPPPPRGGPPANPRRDQARGPAPKSKTPQFCEAAAAGTLRNDPAAKAPTRRPPS